MQEDLIKIAKQAEELDRDDELNFLPEKFERVPGKIFLDANSMGAMPKAAKAEALRMLDDWRDLRREGWNKSDWITLPGILGDALSPLVGAPKGSIIFTDTTSVNLYKALGQALALNRQRKRIVTHKGNFPSDIHIITGLAEFMGGGYDIVIAETQAEAVAAIDENTAVATFSHVSYLDGERFDMQLLSNLARDKGALSVWDLSHSAGAVPIDLVASGADFAVGCGYKYLSVGPCGPAYIYGRKEVITGSMPVICGWIGHENPMAFDPDFVPAPDIRRYLVGTPPAMANALAKAAAEIWNSAPPEKIWARHASLSNFFCEAVTAICSQYGIEISSPATPEKRGGHVSLKAPGAGSVVEALLSKGVVGSFRYPDSIRFGISAFAVTHQDLYKAVEILATIMQDEIWKQPEFADVAL